MGYQLGTSGPAVWKPGGFKQRMMEACGDEWKWVKEDNVS